MSPGKMLHKIHFMGKHTLKN